MKHLLYFIFAVTLAVVSDYCLGNFDTPYIWCVIDPIVGGSLIMAGGSLLSGLLGSSSQSSANAANVQMQRETNALNEKMFNKQMDFNSLWNQKNLAYQRESWDEQKNLYNQMWQQQMDYNSPVAQMQRYKESGINPYFAAGNIDAGNVQSSFSPSSGSPSFSSAPSANPAQSPHVQAYDPTQTIMQGAAGISSLIGNYSHSDLLAEQARAEHINNITRLQENKARIAELSSRNNVNNATAAKLKAEEHRIDYLLESEYKSLQSSSALNLANAETARQQKALLKEETRMKQLSADYQQAVNDFLPNLQQAELEEVKSRISANNASAFAQYESGKLSKAQAATESVNKTIKELDKKGIKIDLKNKPKLISLTLKGMKYQNEISKLQKKGVELDNRQKGADYWNPFRYLGSTGASAAGAAVLKAVPK